VNLSKSLIKHEGPILRKSLGCKVISVIMVTALLLSVLPMTLLPTVSATDTSLDVTYKEALDALLVTVAQTTPTVDSVGGEWAVLAVNRGGVKNTAWNNAYLDTVEAFLKNPNNIYSYDPITGIVKIHGIKITDNERVILALSSVGVDASNFRGFDLVSALLEKGSNGQYLLPAQGTNGVIFALIALDSGNYLPGTDGQVLRQWCIDYLLNCKLSSGGWNLNGIPILPADVDITGMAIQALAPYYKTNADVKTAVDNALTWLRSKQNANGGYASGYDLTVASSTESIVQVIVALSALGIDATSWTQPGGYNLMTALLQNYNEAGGWFGKEGNTAKNVMSTEQGTYGLVAYDRFLNGKNTLYNMSDAFAKPIIYGDITGDGIVNRLDQTVLNQYFSGTLPAGAVFIMANADVNGDGVFNRADQTRFNQYFSGVDPSPLGPKTTLSSTGSHVSSAFEVSR